MYPLGKSIILVIGESPTTLCITYYLIKHQSFVYTQLNDQTVLFQTIPFSISHLFAHSLNVKQFEWLIDVRCYHSGAERTWEQWQWRGIPHPPKFQKYWSLAIRCNLMTNPGNSLGSSYPSAEMQSVYSTIAADWAWGRPEPNQLYYFTHSSKGQMDSCLFLAYYREGKQKQLLREFELGSQNLFCMVITITLQALSKQIKPLNIFPSSHLCHISEESG